MIERLKRLGKKSVVVGLFAVQLASLSRCGQERVVHSEDELRSALSQGNALVRLARGTIEVSSEIEIPPGAHDLKIVGADGGSVLRMSKNFRGRAVLLGRSVRNLELSDFSVQGNREFVDERVGLPPSNVTFGEFYRNNGLIFENVEQLTIRRLELVRITNFAIIVSRGTGVRIEQVHIRDSGSLNEKGRNNTSGGILIEEGTSGFHVLGCKLENVRGNGIWTHSRYGSPRNHDGVIEQNEFHQIARDAIQIGHATRILVENNRGTRIGYPFAEVDIEGQGFPVGIDTAGNTDETIYTNNHFEETNGKCIDLDGFHHGEVRANRCINRGSAADYPLGHFGIIMNNTNPDMKSESIIIEDNEVDGATYGGLFLIGSGHVIRNNRFRNLNRARCAPGSSDPRCNYWPDEPVLLHTGIYLGRRAERPAVTRDNIIENNVVTGFGMGASCIAAAPGIDLSANQINGNRCSEN